MWRKASPLILVIGLLALSQAFCCSTAGGSSCANPNQSYSRTPSTPQNPPSAILTATPAIQAAEASPTAEPEPSATVPPTLIRTQSGAFLPEQRTPITSANIHQLTQIQHLDVVTATDFAFSPQSDRLYVPFLSGENSSDGALTAVDLLSGETVYTLKEWQGQGIPLVLPSVDGKQIYTWLLSTAPTEIQTWVAESGQKWGSTRALSGFLSLAPGREVLALLSKDGTTIQENNWVEPRKGFKIALPDWKSPCMPQYSPGGEVIAVSSAVQGAWKTLLLEPDSGKVLQSIDGLNFNAFAPDGKSLVGINGDGTLVQVYGVAGGDKQVELPGQEISAAAYSPDGKLLLVFSQLTRLEIWDLAGKKVLYALDHEAWQAHFSADMTLLATADSGAGGISIYTVTP